MRVFGALLACALTVLAMALPLAASAADPDQEAIDAVNKIRHHHGLRSLRESPSLHRSATRYARLMILRDYFGHAAHIEVSAAFRTAGEALAEHSGRSAAPRSTVRQWMASPPHRALLLSRQFRFVGMGFARGYLGSWLVTTWVAHFGTL